LSRCIFYKIIGGIWMIYSWLSVQLSYTVSWEAEKFKYILFSPQMTSNRAGLAGDGFFLNLGNVLLSLCQPFLDPQSSKLTRIDPRYCITPATVDTISQEGTTVHLRGLQAETKLCPPESEGKVIFQWIRRMSHWLVSPSAPFTLSQFCSDYLFTYKGRARINLVRVYPGLQINIWLDRTFVRSLLILVGHNLNLVGQKPTPLNLVGHI
jgi:hypothetical protein